MKYKRRWTSAHCFSCHRTWNGLWLDLVERCCIYCGFEFTVIKAGGEAA